MPHPWSVEFYVDRRGHSPIAEWLDGLPSKERAKAARFLRLLAELGTHMPSEHAAPLTGHAPIWELRPLPNRLLYFAYAGRRFIILHGFRKKGRKTRRSDIEIAERRLADFLEGERNDAC